MARRGLHLPRLFLAAFLTAGTAAFCTADAPPGYHDITVQAGGKPTVIRVKDSVGPRLIGGGNATDGPYNPENMDLGRSSSLANKPFSTASSALSKTDTAAEAQGDHSFQIKSFAGYKSDPGNSYDRKYSTASFASSSRSGNDFQKSFATSTSTLTQGKDTSFAAKTSDFQDHAAILGGPRKPFFGGFSDLNDKTFTDPALNHVKRDPYASANNLDVSRMVDLPDRPLTIDEVRNLVNHEAIPNLDAKPDAPSKALNDPGYEPPAALPPAHDDLVTPGPEEKDTDLPSPGEIAAPVNPGPLPK